MGKYLLLAATACGGALLFLLKTPKVEENGNLISKKEILGWLLYAAVWVAVRFRRRHMMRQLLNE